MQPPTPPPDSAADPEVDADVDAESHLHFREITRDNYAAILRLEVAEAQRRFVATNAVSLAQALFHDEAYYRAIYLDDTPIGFFMLEHRPARAEYALWRFMIDARHQRRGHGRRALARIIDLVRTFPRAIELFLSHVPGEGNPGPFYERLGFTYTGDELDGEPVMRLDLRRP